MAKNNDALLAKLSQLTPAQREALLKKLKQQKVSSHHTARPMEVAIAPITRTANTFPLSFSQQRLWFLEQLYPNSAAYNIAAAIELHGPLQRKLLEQSFLRIIQRHESLRSRFIDTENGAQQEIITAFDWRLVTSPLAEKQLMRQLEKDASTPFDLSQAPLLRVHLYQLGEEHAVLSIVMHHIISDAWSAQILLSEVSRIYTALVQNTSLVMPSPAIQYIDFAAWQKDWLENDYCQEQSQFWQEKLKQCQNLHLAGDKPRPAVMTQNGANYTLTISQSLSHQLQSLCQSHNATLYNGLLSVFQVLLYRYSQQNQFCVGTPVAGRIHSDTENLIGFFVNTQALPCDIHPGDSFKQLLRKVRKTTIDAQDKQDVPFEQLLDQLPITRDSSHTPVFQVFFSYQPGIQEQAVQLPDIQARFITVENHTAKFEVSLVVRDTAQGLQCIFEYNTDIFSHAEIEQLANHFKNLVHAVCQQQDSPIETLPLLSRDEIQALLRSEDAIARPAHSIKDLFEQQAALHPEKTAVVQGQSALDYQTLNSKANQLAHYLLAQGVGQGDFIGLCYPPSIDLSIALLAVIKTGACYIPMDPSYPAERLDYMMDFAGVKLMLSSQRLALKAASSHPIIHSDTLDTQSLNTSNPDCTISLEKPLYAIYTSGSTGTPKAAMISHANESNLLHWYSKQYALQADDRFLVFSAIGFDLTQKNLLAPLCMGAELHFSACEYYDPQVLLQTIAERQITWINCAPSAFYPLIDEQQLDKLQSIKKLFFGGENIRLDNLQTWIQSDYCHASITNMYGPTECTDIASSYTLDDNKQAISPIPIGRPASNVQLYILDAQMNLLPKGAIGELYIGGMGVGLGYLNNAQNTAQQFIANPFCQGEILYKTGDLVRYNANNDLVFISRADNQLKIRGFRIELGEIEAHLRQIDGVIDAVVNTQEHNQQKQLVAFLRSRQALKSTQHYRKLLLKKLPNYMVPMAFQLIDHIPLSPNGKVDRNRLEKIDLQQLHSSTAYIAPRTSLEETLQTLWQDVLGVNKIGVHDNFFDIGGNSLSATQIITRIRQHFSLDLPLRSLFEVNTIEGIAEIISAMSLHQETTDADEDFEEGIL